MNNRIIQLLALASLATPLYASVPAAQAASVVCPAPNSLQSRVMAVAPKWVATTVGLLSKVNEGAVEGMASGSGVVSRCVDRYTGRHNRSGAFFEAGDQKIAPFVLIQPCEIAVYRDHGRDAGETPMVHFCPPNLSRTLKLKSHYQP